MADENALITRVVEKLGEDLEVLDAGPAGSMESVEARVAIGTFLVRVAVARTNAAQGWLKLSHELGREQMIELLDKIAGRAPSLPPAEEVDQ